MKKLLLLYVLFALLSSASAQDSLQVVHVHENVSTHIVSPEPIQYVDISTDEVAGDIPVANILRVKPKHGGAKQGIITIVGERFLVQYRLAYSRADQADTRVRIDPTQVDNYLNPAVAMSREDMARFALLALGRKPRFHSVTTKEQGIRARLNNIYTVGDYFFIDLSLKNDTSIPYTIDQVRFKLEDKKVVKATNFQQVELQPSFQLYDTGYFKRQYRNVFVFRKFTFPEEKVLHIEVAEEQVSGRRVSLRIAYADLLQADTL
ncbi:conjugative transposon protein TraN [Pontibacter korlensis]|uniref:Conjugal transfer protein TraN n=1 Tax=Pontibacter korlensis TaxID=400092 RepID=A0A0E3UUN3_9BACT|nr:conjugative transposon protein TraN [Pontibacter korlensis]AKD01907.1 conjugal transfer protein TraN [Pontibacter korlensis]